MLLDGVIRQAKEEMTRSLRTGVKASFVRSSYSSGVVEATVGIVGNATDLVRAISTGQTVRDAREGNKLQIERQERERQERHRDGNKKRTDVGPSRPAEDS